MEGARLLLCAPQNYSADLLFKALAAAGITNRFMIRLNDPRIPPAQVSPLLDADSPRAIAMANGAAGVVALLLQIAQLYDGAGAMADDVAHAVASISAGRFVCRVLMCPFHEYPFKVFVCLKGS